MIVGLAPVRMSFAGGGTDMPEYFEEFGGRVITTAISPFTYAIIQPRHNKTFQAFSPDFQAHYKPTTFKKISIKDGTEISSAVIKYLNYQKGVNVIVVSDVQAGSGLGASSSLTVNLVNTIIKQKNQKWSKKKIAETAFHIGRNMLNWPIGKQDEYISSFGGFNFIKFEKDKVKVVPIKLNKSTFQELENNILLFFIGKTRKSSNILTDQIKRIKQKDKTTIKSLLYVKQLAEDMYDSLAESDITKFGNLLHKGWTAKKKFAKNITNPQIDQIYKKALAYGAVGGKLTGAGGGGHMIFYCEPQKQKKLIKQMHSLGLKKITFQFYNKGPKVLNLFDFT